jgi:hypothetical protein
MPGSHGTNLPAEAVKFPGTMKLRTLVCLMAAAAPSSMVAQSGDQAVLSIKVAGREIGHETFLIRPARPGRPVGDSIVTVARYPETRPELTVQGVLQLSTTGAPLTFALDYQNRRQPETILVSVSKSRVTLRRVARGAESARELPGGDPIVLLDDSLFATYLPLAGLASNGPRTVTAIFPHTTQRAALTVTRTSLTTPRENGAITVIEFTGDLVGRLYLDSAGRFISLEIPARKLEVSRLPK